MTVSPTVLTNAYVAVAGNDLSSFATKVTINTEYEDLDATTFGQTAHVRRAGLEDGSIDVDWLNDYTAATGLDAIMWPLRGTVVTFQIQPVAGSVTTANPKFTGSILINKWSGVSGDVGKLANVSSSFPTSGATTRATS